MPFSTGQLEQLDARIDEGRVHTRRKQGIELRYLEGHDVIDMANTVFGYHAWSYLVTKLEMGPGIWLATILLTVTTADGETVQREDVGVGIPAVAREAGEASPDAQETAVKGAVTDALKRALRTFGNAFGNSLYDKAEAAAARDDQPVRLQSRVAEPDAGAEEALASRACPSCDEPMLLRSGTTRDGRPYSAWFCSAKCGQKPVWLAERKAS
ncbi:MAG TPA: Rad52/Rad22 family DNA repair protein [Chloroflexota bacterium]